MISEQIIQVLEKLGEQFGIIIDWSSENIMPYLEELCTKLISYKMAMAIFWIVFMPTLCFISLVITKRLCKKANLHTEYYGGIETAAATMIIITASISIITIVVVGVQIHNLILANTFPEKLIFDFVSNLIQK